MSKDKFKVSPRSLYFGSIFVIYFSICVKKMIKFICKFDIAIRSCHNSLNVMFDRFMDCHIDYVSDKMRESSLLKGQQFYSNFFLCFLFFGLYGF